MTTYRAAYLPAPQSSTSGGYILTLPEHSSLSDAELIGAALPALAEYNAAADAVGEARASESDIIIGEWRD